MVRERPHIRVDFLTLWKPIDKFRKKMPPYVRVCASRTQMYIQPHRFPPRETWRSHMLTCTHTHIPEVVSVEWGTRSRVGAKGSVTQLPAPTQSQSSFHCRPFVCLFVHNMCTCKSQSGKNPFCVCVHLYTLDVCSCMSVSVCICIRLLTVCACQWPALCECSYSPSTNHSRFKNGPLGIISPTCFGTMTLL